VKEQAAAFGDFRQRMLAGAQAAIREADAQLAVPTALYYNAKPPAGPRAASSSGGGNKRTNSGGGGGGSSGNSNGGSQ